MPSIAQLNVRVGLIFKDLDKGLEQVERRLRSSGRRLSQLGSDLTVAISAPLGLIGASAISAAGDVEALQLAMVSTFESAGRSAGEAQTEIEALRKSALAPGLDFEQAIKASIRLQGVGDSAEDARKTIEGVANAVALTGGTAANLESVTVQMSQMISKGKVLSQDLRIIQENMPIISKLMKQAFGTSNAEDIQNLGVTGKEFVDKITLELQKLPKVSGGIQNAIVNAGAAVKNFLATIGLEINKVFDLTGKSDQFSAFLKSAADGFANLSDGAKRFIVDFGLVAVAAGPVIKVFGVLKSTGAQMIDVFQGLAGGVRGLIGTVFGLADSVNRLKLALGVIGLVVAVTAAIYALSQQFDAAAFVTEKFADAQRSVTAETAKERGELDKNFEVLKNVTATHGERKEAIDKLLKQYPDYFKNINLEIQSVDQLTRIQRDLTGEIERSVAARKKSEALNAIYEKRADILFRIKQLQEGAQATVSESTLIDTGDLIKAGSISQAVIQKLQAQADGLKDSAGQVGKQFDEAFGLVGSAARRASPASKVLDDLKTDTNELTNSQYQNALSSKQLEEEKKKQAKASREAAKAAREQAKAEKEVFDELDAITDQLLAMNEQEQRLKDLQVAPKIPEGGGLGNTQFGTALAPVQSTTAGTDRLKEVQNTLGSLSATATEALTPIDQLLQAMSNHAIGFSDSWKILTDLVQESSGTMGQALGAAATAFAESAASGEASFKSLGQAALQGAAAVIRAKLIESVASVAADAFKKFGLLGFIGATIGGGAVIGLFNKLVSSIKVPGFALGTNYAPGGLALVGEKGPELINLPRGSQVTPNKKLGNLVGGGANVNLNGEFVLRGQDLVVAFEKQITTNQRIRGY